MTNHEIVAAIIAAGMLPPLSVPVRDAKGGIPADEQERLLLAVCHAVGLYRSVLEGVGMRSEPPAVTEDPGPGVAPKRNAAPRLVVGALKRGVPVLAATFLMIASATASDCADADPSADLAGVQGDFELRVDPRSQKKGNLILIANQADYASTVIAAGIDGTTGQVRRGSLTTIANNFYGLGRINGPEFVQKPTGETWRDLSRPGRRACRVPFRIADGLECV